MVNREGATAEQPEASQPRARHGAAAGGRSQGTPEGHLVPPRGDGGPGQDRHTPQVLQSEAGCHPHQEPAQLSAAPLGKGRIAIS